MRVWLKCMVQIFGCSVWVWVKSVGTLCSCCRSMWVQYVGACEVFGYNMWVRVKCVGTICGCRYRCKTPLNAGCQAPVNGVTPATLHVLLMVYVPDSRPSGKSLPDKATSTTTKLVPKTPQLPRRTHTTIWERVDGRCGGHGPRLAARGRYQCEEGQNQVY